MSIIFNFNNFYNFLFIFELLFQVRSSKLDQIVLISSDTIFIQEHGEHSTNSTESLAGGSAIWDNEGFTLANATQISSSIGDKINGSMRVLLATQSASLTTHLKNFDHTFLSIKFSSIIGRSVTAEDQVSSSTKPPTTTTTTTSSTTTSTPPTTTLPTQGPTITPAILKLNTDSGEEGSKHHHVIEIAIDSHNHNTPEITHRIKKVENASVPKSRKRRKLNSEELFQIHKIISSVANSTKKVDDSDKSLPLGASYLLPANPGSEEPLLVNDNISSDKATKKLPYETWKLSMDKSFRPPGFYVTVDDRVIFDNWIGTWKNPSVMGRWISLTKKRIWNWNETDLLLEFESDPDRDIKINFEWEPPDAYSYLFLSNITISTYGSNTTAQNILLNSSESSSDANTLSGLNPSSISGIGGNKNITLYIVVKSHSTEVINDHSSTPVENKNDTLSGQSPPNVRTLGDDQARENYTTVDSGSAVKQGGSDKDSTSTTVSKIKELDQHDSKENVEKKNSHTGLLVACFTGVFALIILVFLVHKRMQLSRRQGNGC